MRLVHLADLHLGFRQYHRTTPTGINQREADVALAFRRAIDETIALRPELVVIAGDVFHTVRPLNPAIVDAFSQFHRLATALPDAAIVMVAGNHDRPRATETGCILTLFARIGIHVVVDEPRRIDVPALGLSVLAVPDLTAGGERPALTPDPGAKWNVLLLHGEVAGVVPAPTAMSERAVMEIAPEELHAPTWSYVALGHYHVHREVAPNAYYAGSLEYTSTNPWGELLEERAAGVPGKGFIEYDLAAGVHRFHAVAGARRLVDLPSIEGRGLSAGELDAAIRERVERCPGGIDDRVVRLLVRDVPRHVVRELDHRALRDYKRRALHFQLDTRKPEVIRLAASGAPGRRATLSETVETYLARRPLDADLDRPALIRLGLDYLREVDAVVERGGQPEPAA